MKKIDVGSRQWMNIEDYGNNLSAMRAVAPANVSSAVPGIDAPCLEYQCIYLNPGHLTFVPSILQH